MAGTLGLLLVTPVARLTCHVAGDAVDHLDGARRKREEMILINTLASHGVSITGKVGESRSDREVADGYPTRTSSSHPALGEG
jgi:hypothetical protein